MDPTATEERLEPRLPVRRAAVSLLFAALVAAATFAHFSGGLFCSTERQSSGANIEHALGLVFAGGVAVTFLLLFARTRPRLRTTVLLMGATVLIIAMVLVGLDSATFAEQRSCGLLTSTETTIDARVYYLFPLWGAPAALLLWTALSSWRQILAAALAATTLVLATWGVSGGAAYPRARNQLPRGTKVFAEPNHDHIDGKVRYDRTPPAGGPHNDVWLSCGVYTKPVRNENAVHSLEHGTVWITYRPDLPRAGVARLRTFVESHYRGEERYLILSPYPGLKWPIVASAWGAQLSIGNAADPRLAEFVARFAGGAQGGEPGGYCTGGTGSPGA
jgi:hypothetical protein